MELLLLCVCVVASRTALVDCPASCRCPVLSPLSTFHTLTDHTHLMPSVPPPPSLISEVTQGTLWLCWYTPCMYGRCKHTHALLLPAEGGHG